jgi:predicted DNA-binding transcriptional regulator YafY
MARIILFPQANPDGVDAGTHAILLAAIRQKHLVQFVFKGNERIVEPHDYGVQNKVARLLAYQVGGVSSSGGLPDWRNFNVANISSLVMLDGTFPGNRPAPSGKHKPWDVLFARVDSADKS